MVRLEQRRRGVHRGVFCVLGGARRASSLKYRNALPRVSMGVELRAPPHSGDLLAAPLVTRSLPVLETNRPIPVPSSPARKPSWIKSRHRAARIHPAQGSDAELGFTPGERTRAAPTSGEVLGSRETATFMMSGRCLHPELRLLRGVSTAPQASTRGAVPPRRSGGDDGAPAVSLPRWTGMISRTAER